MTAPTKSQMKNLSGRNVLSQLLHLQSSDKFQACSQLYAKSYGPSNQPPHVEEVLGPQDIHTTRPSRSQEAIIRMFAAPEAVETGRMEPKNTIANFIQNIRKFLS